MYGPLLVSLAISKDLNIVDDDDDDDDDDGGGGGGG